MPVGIILYRWTDQGLRNIKDSVARTRSAISAVEKAGAKATVYFTQGQYDMVGVFEGFKDDEAASAILFGALKAGNIRTETMRAFTIDEMERILQKVP